MKKTLAEQFPQLSFAKDADEWLANIGGKTIREQLEERRIKRVRIMGILFSAALGIQDDDFVVILNNLNFGHDALSFGHEIGHTFHFDLTETPPKLIIPEPNEISDRLFNLIENFCTAFSSKWLKIVGREEIEERCRNERAMLPSISTCY